MKSPCARECEDSSESCHAACEAYQVYEAEKLAGYERRIADKAKTAYSADAERRANSGERLRRIGRAK